MLSSIFFAKFKKLRFTNPLKFQTFIAHLALFFVIVIFLAGSNYVRAYRTIKDLPFLENPVVIANESSPTPVLDPSPNLSPIEQKGPVVQKEEKKVASKSNPLCRDVKEGWKLVPDPSHEGLFVICNTKNEQMATADELNGAQNEYRVTHGLNSLSINSGLCKVAGERAQEISKNFSHDGFEAAIERSGVEKHSFGENIASGPLSAVHFIEWSWDRSAGHRENMLGDWTDGCGGVYLRYAVFLFAK